MQGPYNKVIAIKVFTWHESSVCCAKCKSWLQYDRWPEMELQQNDIVLKFELQEKTVSETYFWEI